MELEHRFEVPVGIESAWPSLLDMSQVAACFPGATLTSADGDTYTGSVKVKLGPIQLTYQGKARIVEADEANHRAVIEASGAASRSASTASMTVTATATPVAEDRTAVDMITNLTITGRPAQFGRGVMVEVGNKILGQFADCLSSRLGASAGVAGQGGAPDVGQETAPAAASGDGTSEGSGAPDGAGGPPDAATTPAGATAPDGATHAGAATATPAGPAGAGPASAAPSTAAGDTSASIPSGAGPRHAAPYTRSPEPIDLLESAGPSIVKRVVPLIAGLILLIVLRAALKRRRRPADLDE